MAHIQMHADFRPWGNVW